MNEASGSTRPKKNISVLKTARNGALLPLSLRQRKRTDGRSSIRIRLGARKCICLPPKQRSKAWSEPSKHPKSTKFGRQNPISERWNSEEQLVVWRKAWADVTNRYLERYGHDARIDHRSHAERGLVEQPTIHEGVVARAMEKKGIISDRCELNRQIKADNALLRELKAAVKKLAQEVLHSLPELAKSMEFLRQKLLIFCYQLNHIRTGKSVIGKSVDAWNINLNRYSEVVDQIKETKRERTDLLAEKKELPFWNIPRKNELTARIAELTELLEELQPKRRFFWTIWTVRTARMFLRSGRRLH